MKPAVALVDCPSCRMSLRIPAADILLCSTEQNTTTERIRFACPDCGKQYRTTTLDLVARLLDGGMPEPIEEDDILAFQIGMWAADRDGLSLSDIANQEVPS